MGAIGVGVADAVDDGDFAFIPQIFDGAHAGVKSEVIVNGQDGVGSDVNRGSEIVIKTVAVRYYGVEAVIAAAKLYHYQLFVALRNHHLLLSGRMFANGSSE